MTQGSFSAQLQEEAQPVWAAIFKHPFLQEIQAGTLPLENFRFYLCQDYHYLGAFARAAALALAKTSESDTMQLLSQRLLRPIERSLHGQLFKSLGMDLAEVERARPAPTNLAYMNHMLATASLGGVGETAAALLPCPWTYDELGRTLHPIEHPIYKEWAGFYEAGYLEESVKAWRALVDGEAAKGGPGHREAMRRAFHTSSRYEYLFWQMAHRQEEWPL